MKFIIVTDADGNRALIPIESIEYITDISYINSKTQITFKYGKDNTILYVTQSFDEIIEQIKAATAVK